MVVRFLKDSDVEVVPASFLFAPPKHGTDLANAFPLSWHLNREQKDNIDVAWNSQLRIINCKAKSISST